MLPDSELVRRGDVNRHLGWTGRKLTAMIKKGIIKEIHFEVDKKGRPQDRAYFRRNDVEALVNGLQGAGRKQ